MDQSNLKLVTYRINVNGEDTVKFKLLGITHRKHTTKKHRLDRANCADKTAKAHQSELLGKKPKTPGDHTQCVHATNKVWMRPVWGSPTL
jgi:hypothetical protein